MRLDLIHDGFRERWSGSGTGRRHTVDLYLDHLVARVAIPFVEQVVRDLVSVAEMLDAFSSGYSL